MVNWTPAIAGIIDRPGLEAQVGMIIAFS